MKCCNACILLKCTASTGVGIAGVGITGVGKAGASRDTLRSILQQFTDHCASQATVSFQRSINNLNSDNSEGYEYKKQCEQEMR